jgi:hypothetical protein
MRRVRRRFAETDGIFAGRSFFETIGAGFEQTVAIAFHLQALRSLRD